MTRLVVIMIITASVLLCYQTTHAEDNPSKFFENFMKAMEEREAKAKEFEPVTMLGKFMGVFVSSFLIISLPLILVGGMLSTILDDFWRKIIKVYFFVTAYLLLSYVPWMALNFFKFRYTDITICGWFCFSALICIGVMAITHLERKKAGKESELPVWICPKCGVDNHYHHRCWNCKTESKFQGDGSRSNPRPVPR